MKKRLLILFYVFLFSFTTKAFANDEVPSFAYVDIELFSTTLTEGYPLTSGIFVDWYSGSVLIHLGFAGSYGEAAFYGFEAGVGIPISKSFEENVETSYISNIWTSYHYNYKVTHYEVSRTRADKIKLTLLDFGIKYLGEFYFNKEYPDEKKLFDKTYSDMAEYEVYAYDTIFYGGIKLLHVLNSALTLDELVLYGHVLVGMADRKANIWTSYSNDPVYTPTYDKTVLGFEIGFRYWITNFRLGYYDEFFYFNAGFRIPFTLGF